MIKAIFFDVDGTLLPQESKEIPESTEQSLHKLQEIGVKIFLATGRHTLELEQLPVNRIKFDGYITLNGQLCLNHKKEVLSGVPFDHGTAQEIVSIFRQREIPVVLVEADRMYINFVDDIVRDAQQKISTEVPPVDVYKNGLIYQATVFLKQSEEPLLRAKLPERCKLARWSSHGIDIISAARGKVSGIKYIQEAFDLETGEIMAFGDAENDMDMLNYAGIGVAMGNAEEMVKETADFVTKDAHHDGIRAALHHFHIL